MKLVRFGSVGAERPGMLDEAGNVRDLGNVVDDIDLSADPHLLERLLAIDPASLPQVENPGRFGPPVARVGKFIAIGFNYRDHVLEGDLPVPEEPIIFSKATSCIVGPDDDVLLPQGSTKTDWEVELGIVIGRRASYVAEDSALEHVAGYLVVNDISEREFQFELGGSWDKGKGCDSFGPIGPWLVTRDEVPDPQVLDLWLDLNGSGTQRGNTGKMIFSCAQIVSYVSRFMTLLPGDIITTGTPPGVGMAKRPTVFLRPGDVVTLGISGLGAQRQEVRAHAA